MPVPLWIAKIAGNAVGGAIGKALGKVADWVPGPRQFHRQQIRKIQDEIKLLQNGYSTDSARARLIVLTSKLSEHQKALEEE